MKQYYKGPLKLFEAQKMPYVERLVRNYWTALCWMAIFIGYTIGTTQSWVILAFAFTGLVWVMRAIAYEEWWRHKENPFSGRDEENL